MPSGSNAVAVTSTISSALTVSPPLGESILMLGSNIVMVLLVPPPVSTVTLSPAEAGMVTTILPVGVRHVNDGSISVNVGVNY